MTDVLTERFAALANLDDDSDWLDVQRRARRTRAWPVAVAAAAAAMIAAAAVAAGNTWVFSSHDRQVTASTSVRLHGRTWQVAVTSGGRLRICLRVSGAGTECHGKPLVLGARHVDVPGGQIWAGAALGFTRRVSITDANGVEHSTTVFHAPRGTKTPLRYWVIAVPSSTMRAITAYDANGRKLTFRAS